MDKKQNPKDVPVLRKILLFTKDAVKQVREIPKIMKQAKKMEPLSKELLQEDTKEHLLKLKQQDEKAFRNLKTPKEKILFFYRYFSKSNSTHAKENALTFAYVMTYLSENTNLVKEDDPFALVTYFENNSAYALEQLFKEQLAKPFNKDGDRVYESLLQPVDGEPLTDAYKLQCLIVATCAKANQKHPCGRWPYSFDTLSRPAKTENA